MENVYDIKAYNIIRSFFCNNKKMLVIRMSGAACVMPEEDYHRLITEGRRYRRWKRRNAA